MSAFHLKESRGREQVELLPHVTPYLFFDNRILVGMNKNTSATATVVTRCHVSVALSSLDLVRMFQKLESIEVALFCDDFLGLVTDMRGCSSFFWQPVYITLVYCGSFASVHRHKPASPSRVSALHPTSLHCCFSDSSLQAPSCVRVANRDCPCTDGSDLVGLDQSSWKQLHQTTTGFAVQPACVPLHSR